MVALGRSQKVRFTINRFFIRLNGNWNGFPGTRPKLDKKNQESGFVYRNKQTWSYSYRRLGLGSLKAPLPDMYIPCASLPCAGSCNDAVSEEFSVAVSTPWISNSEMKADPLHIPSFKSSLYFLRYFLSSSGEHFTRHTVLSRFVIMAAELWHLWV